MTYAYIIAGGTLDYIDSHFASCAPAFGRVGPQLLRMFTEFEEKPWGETIYMPTRMALGANQREPEVQKILIAAGLDDLRTTDDLACLIDHLVADKTTRCIVMAAAVADFHAEEFFQGSIRLEQEPGKKNRMSSAHGFGTKFARTEKLIDRIRKERKDIFLVSFKQEWGVDKRALFLSGLRNLKRSSSNLVFANDTNPKSLKNIVITPEEYFYEFDTREEALRRLVHMTCERAKNTFKRTKVVVGKLVQITELVAAGKIPSNFVHVLKWLLGNGAFHPFEMNKGAFRTTGHFGCRVEGEDYVAISSVRKANHNCVFAEGMVKIYPNRDNFILAEGAKPSVGEHTQQFIYERMGDKVHSIVHFHAECVDSWPHRAEQLPYECGSVECAQNTNTHMQEIGAGVYAVHLNGHGPNIAFHKDVPAERIIELIQSVWDFKTNPLEATK